MTDVVPDKRARQGGPGRPVLYVLIASLALVAVYLVSLLGWSSTAPPSQPQTTSGSATPGQTGTPAPPR